MCYVSMCYEISKTPNIVPRILRKSRLDLIGKMECILGDSVEGAHDRVVSKLTFLAPIANERVFRGIKIIDSSSQSFAIGKNDPDELLVPFTPLHRDAPHPFQCSCEMQGAYAREGW